MIIPIVLAVAAAGGTLALAKGSEVTEFSNNLSYKIKVKSLTYKSLALHLVCDIAFENPTNTSVNITDLFVKSFYNGAEFGKTTLTGKTYTIAAQGYSTIPNLTFKLSLSLSLVTDLVGNLKDAWSMWKNRGNETTISKILETKKTELYKKIEMQLRFTANGVPVDYKTALA